MLENEGAWYNIYTVYAGEGHQAMRYGPPDGDGETNGSIWLVCLLNLIFFSSRATILEALFCQ
jgi:hypothetical protein